jgi:glycosyltransferase domain-containing protein
MDYMSHQNCQYKILVADGSIHDEAFNLLSSGENYKNLEYTYIRYSPDINIGEFYRKKIDICSRVITKYLLLADNDDFYSLKEIKKYINFLENNDDYIGCRGRYVSLTIYDEKWNATSLERGKFYRAIEHESQSIDQAADCDRVTEYLENVGHYSYMMNWYSIYRTEDFNLSIKKLYNYNFPDVVLNEILLLISLLKIGKLHAEASLFYIRQEASSQMEKEYFKENNLFKQFLLNDSIRDFKVYCNHIGMMNTPELSNALMLSFANYLEKYIATDLSAKDSGRKMLRNNLIRLMKKNFYIYKFLMNIKCKISHCRKMKLVKLNSIEPFILNKSS